MDLSKYDFRYKGVMKNAMQSIPLGNGDLGVNVWADKNSLYLLLSKTDAWSELHRLLKTGLIKLSLSPNPFNRGTAWRLSYSDGMLCIQSKDASFEIYVDANSPSYRLSYRGDIQRTVRLEIENYRSEPIHFSNTDNSNFLFMAEKPFDYECVEAADRVFSEEEHTLGQFHHNETSCYDFTLKHQSLDGFEDKNDPLLNLTFGFLAKSEQLVYKNGCLEGENLKGFDLTVVSHTAQCEGEAWVKKAYDILKNTKTDLNAHKRYWQKIWARSFVEIKSGRRARQITEACTAQRYMNICSGRGSSPVKFNGSIFTNQPSPHIKDKENYDYRRWGGTYWFQNTRLVYWAMLYFGDYELMKPFFRLYLDALPLAKYRTQKYFSHEGAFFPETMTLFGTYTNKDYGRDRSGEEIGYVPNPYIRYYYSGALELCEMMLQYAAEADDGEFLKNEALPFIGQVLKFFRNHYKLKNGKLYFYPSASLETWQDCADDTPTTAGLYEISEKILKLDCAEESLKKLCDEILTLLPPIPLCSKRGRQVIAPFGENMDKTRRNVENPELYTVFPYFRYGLGKENLKLARDTFALRGIKESGGWQQHGVQAALLGLYKEAEKELLHNSRNKNKNCIFPAFWGPNYDWLPDQDNGSNLMMMLAKMLVQTDENTVRLLPAWNKKRSVSFRLPICGECFIEAEYSKRGGLTYKLSGATSKRILFDEKDAE